MELMLEARGLVKRFGRTPALDGLDLSARSGQVVALLGPNGAGKTTFVRAVATLLPLDGGQLRVGGYDVRRDAAAVRRTIALAGQFAAVEPAMTGRENLQLIARLSGRDRKSARQIAAELLERFALTEVADRLVRTYSGGMRRKLDLAASLVGAPRLLLLDEPTTGLDPRSRIELWDAIHTLVARGTDVLLTTQYLDEADQLAGHIVIVDHGRVVAEGSPSELKRRIGSRVIELRVRSEDQLDAVAHALEGVERSEVRVDRQTHQVSAAVEGDGWDFLPALRALAAAGLQIDDMAVRQPRLDEVFLALTGTPTPTPSLASLAP